MTLKELREKEKISQAKLAKALGVSSTLISAIETGVKPASNAVIDKVKEVYETSCRRIRTGVLNDVLNDATNNLQPPLQGTRRLKIFYATHVSIMTTYHVTGTI